MGIRNKEIIAQSTGEVTSGAFSVLGTQSVNADVLEDGESVKIQYTHDGAVWQDLYLNGVLQEITSEHSIITMQGPGLFRCVKSVTVGLVGVNLWITGAEQ